jgi:hypothetical protein
MRSMFSFFVSYVIIGAAFSAWSIYKGKQEDPKSSVDWPVAATVFAMWPLVAAVILADHVDGFRRLWSPKSTDPGDRT